MNTKQKIKAIDELKATAADYNILGQQVRVMFADVRRELEITERPSIEAAEVSICEENPYVVLPGVFRPFVE